MSAMVKPLIATYEADATNIAKGVAVKFGSSNKRVVICTASTDPAIGITQNASVNVGDLLEVALTGGGGKALAHGSITKGKLLVPYTDGSMQQTTGANDRICALAMDDAVAGDIFSTQIVSAIASGANQ